jgi:AraC family transcriptional activator of pobA
MIENFYINYYKDKNIEHINRIDEHQHTYYEIIWVETGHGVHTIDLTDYSYSGPCLFLLHPKNVHKIHKKTLSQGGVIKFNDRFFENDEPQSKFLLKFTVFNDVDVFPVINLSTDEAKEIKSFFEILHSQGKTDQIFTSALILNLLKSLLLKIYQIKKKNVPIQSISNFSFIQFQEFQALIEHNFKQQHRLTFYCEILKVSSKTLNEICKNISHKTSQGIVKDRLLLEAKRMLMYTHLSVKEIAFHLGFEDSAYFTRFFTTNIKLSPKAFKKSNS